MAANNVNWDDWNKKINQIPWCDLDASWGKAASIPQALKSLTSSDEYVREKSHRHLENQVVLQSDLYEPAFYVVPFLLDILRNHENPDRRIIYDLLYEIGNGWAPQERSLPLPDGNKVEMGSACRERVRSGLDFYLSDLKRIGQWDTTTNLRLIDLLGSLNEDKQRVLPEFLAALDVTDDPKVKEHIRSIIDDPEY